MVTQATGSLSKTFQRDSAPTSTRSRKKAQCKAGKPCGNICIPKDATCRENASSSAAATSQSAKKASSTQVGRKIQLSPIQIAGLTVAAAISAGIIADTIRDRQNLKQFLQDRKEWEKRGIPPELAKAYDHPNKDLAISLLAAENRIKGNNYETMYAFNEKGDPLFIRAGGTTSVSPRIQDLFQLANRSYKAKDNVYVTHNHPFAGGTLSPADIYFAGNFHLSEIRATGKNDIYILRAKPKGVLGEGERGRHMFGLGTGALATEYSQKLAPRVKKARKQFFNKQNLLGKVYYSTIGAEDPKFVKQVLQEVEVGAHQDLRNTLFNNSAIGGEFDYIRVARRTNEAREKQFLTKTERGKAVKGNLLLDAYLDRLSKDPKKMKKPSEPKPTIVVKRKAGDKKRQKIDSLFCEDAVRNAIESIFGEISPYPISKRIAADSTISGHFIADGEVFNYSISPDNELNYVEADSKFSQNYLIGFTIDSGLLKFRQDADLAKPGATNKKKCLTGKPCGGSCIEKGLTCQKQLPEAAVKDLEAVRQVLTGKQISPNKPQPESVKPQGNAPKDKQESKQAGADKSSEFNKAAAAAIAATVLAAGVAAIGSDLEANTQAISGLYQESIQSTGIRDIYPHISDKIEKIIAAKGQGDVDRKVAKSLATSIAAASQEATTKKGRGEGFATPQERLEYIGKMLNDPKRSTDFKIALTKLKEIDPKGPFPEEIAALRYYTDSTGYMEMNLTLRGQDDRLEEFTRTNSKGKDNRSIEQIKADASFDIKLATSALNAMPNYKGKVYRGLNLPQSVLNDMEVGGYWHEKGFTSTTLNPFGRYPGNTAIVMKSKTGKDIRQYEKYANNEVAFLPEAKFQITSKRQINKFGQKFWLIEMDEVGPEPKSETKVKNNASQK